MVVKHAVPKSAILSMRSRRVTSKFSGLMSRWMMPFMWRYLPGRGGVWGGGEDKWASSKRRAAASDEQWPAYSNPMSRWRVYDHTVPSASGVGWAPSLPISMLGPHSIISRTR